MIIEICGPGCPRCLTAKKNVLQALKELDMELGEDVMVIHVNDVKEIIAKGVIFTPALIIDGVKVCEGRIPNPKEIKKWIEERK